jgi:hypothetical protein
MFSRGTREFRRTRIELAQRQLLLPMKWGLEVPTVTVRIDELDLKAVVRHFVRSETAGGVRRAGLRKMANSSCRKPRVFR